MQWNTFFFRPDGPFATCYRACLCRPHRSVMQLWRRSTELVLMYKLHKNLASHLHLSSPATALMQNWVSPTRSVKASGTWQESGFFRKAALRRFCIFTFPQKVPRTWANFTGVIKWHQPKQCTFIGEIPQIYHTFVLLFDSLPKLGAISWPRVWSQFTEPKV